MNFEVLDRLKMALRKEWVFKAIRSSGKGGQNVNKVATKIELRFDIENTVALNEIQIQQFQKRWANRISKEGIFLLSCEEARTQKQNRKRAVDRFMQMLQEALKEEKKRIPTKTPKHIHRVRLQKKRANAQKKQQRNWKQHQRSTNDGAVA